MSRSITLNGVKATIIFHDTISDNPNDKPTINWELFIENAHNKAMIDGSITTDVRRIPATATANATANATDNELLPATTATGTAADIAAIIAAATDYDSDSLPDSLMEDSIALKRHFQDENLTFNKEFMKWYYTCAKRTPTLNRSQKMKAFIHSNKDTLMQFEEGENENRKMMMVSIFKKKNLEFKDVYMDMYYEWQKNAPKQNRYKKMCSFIEAQAFT
jgi:hypothetical protein